ncbi:hypothetical protein SEMRO_2653_G333780.1 [Seminavis robusta]|uniref:Uncharacterized protein n=1 Tax=Seminavis robusta TaxID=568900 RepID=A0A9N8F1L7_9STRA|nr:hypothetical protein SEMRO_2653_G333780.1 [Seminavis robusta]|eukprot:Sro2653_g333780.1 n/a (133) ;mRNA; r:8977-9375
MTPKKRGTPEAGLSSAKRRTPQSASTVESSGVGGQKDPCVPFGVFTQEDADNLPPVLRKSNKSFKAKTETLFCEQPSQASTKCSKSNDGSSDDSSDSMIELPTDSAPAMSSISEDTAKCQRRMEREAIFAAG